MLKRGMSQIIASILLKDRISQQRNGERLSRSSLRQLQRMMAERSRFIILTVEGRKKSRSTVQIFVQAIEDNRVRGKFIREHALHLSSANRHSRYNPSAWSRVNRL